MQRRFILVIVLIFLFLGCDFITYCLNIIISDFNLGITENHAFGLSFIIKISGSINNTNSNRLINLRTVHSSTYFIDNY